MTTRIKLDQVEEIASTSATLKQRAETGGGERALLARRQVAGRGRLGRGWTSAVGNLHLSVLLRPAAPVMPGHWSLLAAVALADCVARLAPLVRLKWPNDVLLDGGKLAGILLEAGADPAWLVIGFGVNLVEAPPGLGRAVSCLRDHGEPPSPEVFARSLIDRLGQWRDRYERDGFAPVRQAWLDLGPAAGSPAAVGSPTGRIEGLFAGIGPQGELLLDQGGVVRTIVSGEVE